MGSGFGQDFPAVVHRGCGEGMSEPAGSGPAPASGQFEPGAVEGGLDLGAGHGAGRASVNSDSPCGSKSIPTVCTPGKARTASTALIMQRQQLSPRTP